jgi:hypothetical protein
MTMQNEMSEQQELAVIEKERYLYRLGDQQAQRRIQAETTRLPDASASMSLTDALKRPVRPVAYLVDKLQGVAHNTALIAEYKTGKTTLLCDYARCLADGEPFLSTFDTSMLIGNVGFWSLEMDDDDLIGYFRNIGVKNTDRVRLLGLRDQRIPFMNNDHAMEYTENWLVENNITTWIVDSWTRMCNGWHGIAEKDNAGYAALCNTVDIVKSRTGVSSSMFTAHFPRAEMAQGAERARGGSALEDWLDARWVLTKKEGDRFLAVNGRRVELEETMLNFDPDTGRSSLGNGNRTNATGSRIRTDIMAFVNKHPGALKTQVKDGVSGNWVKVQGELAKLITEGLISAQPSGKSIQHFMIQLPGNNPYTFDNDA